MARRLDFRDHSRRLDQNRYVYAVVSRRARGLSIGVNLNPDKVCNFDCTYCQVDRTSRAGLRGRRGRLLDGVLALLERAHGHMWALRRRSTAWRPPCAARDIAFSGDGEPTTPPEFPAVAGEAVRGVIDRRRAGILLRLITNATLFDRPRVRAALGFFDELWCKLDAGTEEYFHLVDGTRLPFCEDPRQPARRGTRAPDRGAVAIHATTGGGAAPGEAEIEAYAGRLRDILSEGGRIDRVQVYSVARQPADPRCEAAVGRGGASRRSPRARVRPACRRPSTREAGRFRQASSFARRCPDTSVRRKSRPWKR